MNDATTGYRTTSTAGVDTQYGPALTADGGIDAFVATSYTVISPDGSPVTLTTRPSRHLAAAAEIDTKYGPILIDGDRVNACLALPDEDAAYIQPREFGSVQEAYSALAYYRLGAIAARRA